MRISFVQPLHIGNAIRLFLEPPADAVSWRVLKMGSDNFGGHDDLDYAILVYEGEERVIVDAEHLRNEVKVFYRPYYLDSTGVWHAGETAHATPQSTYEDYSTDVLSIVRQRLEDGLMEEVKRGNLLHEYGYVQVFTAPPSLEQNLKFPLVTITLEDESPSIRGIGDDISGDEFDPVGFDWFDSDGWIAGVRLSIVGWSLNSDERIELRKAIRRIIIGNMAVFSAAGMDMIDLSMSDIDAINGEYNANIYQVMCVFTCIAPTRVGGGVAPIREVHANHVEPENKP